MVFVFPECYASLRYPFTHSCRSNTQMLMLMPGFVLFSAYALWHSQQVRLGQVSLKELAHDLDLALEEALGWEWWFASG